jgi:ABC-2 type transport system permease protein
LLSGFLFSISTMPLALKVATYVVPARYYVTVTKGIFLKGVGLEVLWIDAVAMVIFATVGISLAIRSFKKELA